MWLSMSAASLEMRAASSRTICLRSVRGRRSSPWATPRSPAAFSRAVAARSVRLAACASRLSFRREAAASPRRSTIVCPIASPVLAPLSGRTAHGRRETNEARDGCPRSPVARRPPNRTKTRVGPPYSILADCHSGPRARPARVPSQGVWAASPLYGPNARYAGENRSFSSTGPTHQAASTGGSRPIRGRRPRPYGHASYESHLTASHALGTDC